MQFAKLFSMTVFAAIGIYGAIGFYFLPMASFEGDLTRVGMLPESMFSPTKAQPMVDAGLLEQANWEQADVLVVGDSFSEPRLWQSALTRHGLKIRTETWATLPGICEDFSGWLRQTGFRGKHVILEIIERNTEGTLNRSIGCRNTKWHAPPPAALINKDEKNRSRKLSVGIQVYLNGLRYMHKTGGSGFNMFNDVRVEHLSDGCKLFSHQQCEDILFFKNDRASDMGDSVLNNMEKINSRIAYATPIWVIIPDKSTSYLRPNKLFWDKAENRFQAPNILRTFKQSIKDYEIDLYPVNNTHLSTTGYLTLGETILRSLPH